MNSTRASQATHIFPNSKKYVWYSLEKVGILYLFDLYLFTVAKQGFLIILGLEHFPNDLSQSEGHFNTTAPIAQLVERPLSEREVVGSNPDRNIPKV